ncbi:MAG: protein kinase [Myxococcota bacterium]
MNEQTSSSIPKEIGPYRVLRPIARGGMAEVYEVEERSSGEHLALKLLVQTGGALPRFNREYEAMIRLNHPNIVRVYAYGLHGQSPWLSMELIEGTPIQAYVKRCGKPGTDARTEEVIRLGHDLALALDHIHRRGLVHRDLKSANVLVLPDGRVKLFDFGTARVSDPVQQITNDGEFIGTFAYASPEQLLNEHVDGRSDLYSFGVLLFRMATGKRPFESSDLGELARMHVRDAPPNPKSFAPTLPEGLERIILQLLSKAPADRPQTGAEVAHTLEGLSGTTLRLPGTLDVDQGRERLVGREKQMRELQSFIDHAADLRNPDASGAMALVVGVDGSGRHAIMGAMEREVSQRGWRSVSIFFRPGASDLMQFAYALSVVSRSFGNLSTDEIQSDADAIERMVQATSLAVAERLEVVRQAGARLLDRRAHTDQNPVIVFVRGLQHAGAVGYEALAGLRQELASLGSRVMLIGDCTEHADDPDSLARRRLKDARRVPLPPMSPREVALLVGAMLHRRPPPASVAQRIYKASGGLPTYVEEVVHGLIANGILRVRSRDQNRIEWAQQESWEIEVPEGARERILDHFSALPTDRRRCLEALALMGGEGSVRVVAGAVQRTQDEVLPTLFDLANRGWITMSKRKGFDYATWRQVLAEDVVTGQLQPTRRRLLERLIILQVSEHPAFAAQIRLLLATGQTRHAFLRARDWAVHHLAYNEPVTAVDVLDDVVPQLAEPASGVDDVLRGQLLLLYANCLLASNPTDGNATKALARAERCLKRTGLSAAEQAVFDGEMHLTRAQIHRAIGHFPSFRRELDEAWRHVESTPPSALGAMIATLRGWSDRTQGDVEEAATWHGRARRLAIEVGDPAVRAHADTGVAGWQFSRGLLTEAEATVWSAISVFGDVGDLRGIAEALPVWTHSLRIQGRFSEALGLLYHQMPMIRQCEVPTFYVRLLLANAWCEVDLGRLGQAQECVDELAATLRRAEHLDLRLEVDLVWGRIEVASGLFDDAVQRLGGVVQRAEAAGLTVIAEQARALQAEARWSSGDRSSALTQFSAAVNALRRSGDVPALALACVSQARAMSESVDPDLVFKPLADWLESQPAVCVRIERQIARGRHLKAMGKDSDPAYARAGDMIEQLAQPLSPTDATAFRLHPWSQFLRRSRQPTKPPTRM